MNRVQHPEDGRQGLRSPCENGPSQFDDLDGFEETKHRLTPDGDLHVVRTLCHTQSIQRAQTLDFHQRRGHALCDRSLLPKRMRPTKDDPKDGRGIQVRNRRLPWRSLRRSSTTSRFRRSRSGGGTRMSLSEGAPGTGLRTARVED